MPFWMYFTPIIYPVTTIPEQWRWLLALNPMSSVVEAFKWGTLGVGHLTVRGVTDVAGDDRVDAGHRRLVLQSRGSLVDRQVVVRVSTRQLHEMKILFSMRHSGALRNYSSTIGELARRGHHVHLVFMMQDKLGDGRLLWEVTNDHENVTFSELGKKTPWRFWLGLARGVRAAADYVRYGDARVQGRARAARARRRACAGDLQRRPHVAGRPHREPGLRSSRVLLNVIERAIPTDRRIAELIAEQSPDVVLVTPLVDIGSDQVEYVKACRTLGIRSGLCVHSWDNLTNKGLIRIVPDRVFVWNEAQKREAITMHGAQAGAGDRRPARRCTTSGSRAGRARRERSSAARSASSPDKPFLLYLCSSQFIAPDEAVFIEKWMRAVRSAPDPRVRQLGILIRPHPENAQPWQRFDSSPT